MAFNNDMKLSLSKSRLTLLACQRKGEPLLSPALRAFAPDRAAVTGGAPPRLCRQPANAPLSESQPASLSPTHGEFRGASYHTKTFSVFFIIYQIASHRGFSCVTGATSAILWPMDKDRRAPKKQRAPVCSQASRQPR